MAGQYPKVLLHYSVWQEKKMRKNQAVVYSIYDSRGKRTYIGSTNNPRRRAAQHARSRKLPRGSKLVVESAPMPRKSAQRLESQKLRGYRRRMHRLPRHNQTADGQYRHRKKR